MNESLPMFKFGTPKSPEDVRDVNVVQVGLAALGENVPESGAVDYSNIIHDNQRQLGICTAADMADMLSKFWYEMTGELIEFSEEFIYNVGKRHIDGNIVEGSSLRTMFQVIYKYGAPPKSMIPTDDTRKSYNEYVQYDFSPDIYEVALKYRIPGYARVLLDPIGFARALIASKAGIATRMEVGNSFWTDIDDNITWDGSKISPLRAPKVIVSGHSIKVIKYQGLTIKQLRTARNTWGDSKNLVYPGAPVWGNDGDIDYSYDVQAPYVTEAWVITPQPIMEVFTHKFDLPLSYKQKGAEVVALQRVLIRLGYLSIPSNIALGFYGDLTVKAVYDFQIKNDVAPLATLNLLAGKAIGPLTRFRLNQVQGIIS